MIKYKSIAILLAILLFLLGGCALFDREEEKIELLPVRNVKVIPFPVRALEFVEPLVRQEKNQLYITGSVENVSYSPVANVRVRAIALLAEDETTLVLPMQLFPAVLQPGEKGEFSATGEVMQPVAHVELHIEWEEYYPPGL